MSWLLSFYSDRSNFNCNKSVFLYLDIIFSCNQLSYR